MAKTVYLSKERLEEYRRELKALKEEEVLVKQQISDAREKGDLSENAEYDAAREAKRNLGRQIFRIETIIDNAVIVDNSKATTNTVILFSKVTIRSISTNTEVEYTIVSDEEVDIDKQKIGTSSPLGKALFGKKKGDIVDVIAPIGVLKYEIVKINI